MCRHRILLIVALNALLLACIQPAGAEVVFLDEFDFDPNADPNSHFLDPNKWAFNTEYRPSDAPNYPGTQTRDETRRPTVRITEDGTLLVPLDTHNPTAITDGDSFYGTDIYTRMPFSPGLKFETRLRLANSSQRGYVGSFFLFETESIRTWDEIDFELLSNDMVDNNRRVVTNVYDEYPDVPFRPEDLDPNRLVVPDPNWLDISEWHKYEIDWQETHVTWKIIDDDDPNKFVSRTEMKSDPNGLVPDDCMHAHLIMHAPGPGFDIAHDPSFLPVADPNDNEPFYLEVDYVRVTGEIDEHAWIATDPNGEWSNASNWYPNGAPASQWVAQLHNADPNDKKAVVSLDPNHSTVDRATISGDTNDMNLVLESGATLTARCIYVENHGIVSGNGTIAGDLHNKGGTLSPGESVGVFTVNGNYSQDPNSVLKIEIEIGLDGTVIDYDRVSVSGEVGLGGKLDVMLLDPNSSFSPEAGDSFEIITAGEGVFRSFDSAEFPELSGDLEWFVNNRGTSVELITTFAGDFDFDGDVDGNDFLKWQRDPSVGSLADWEENYGAEPSPITAASAAVPEPATCIVLILAMMLLLFRRDVVVS